MDKAPDYESGDSRLESWRGQNKIFVTSTIISKVNNKFKHAELVVDA